MTREELGVASGHLWRNVERAMSRGRGRRRVIYVACPAWSKNRRWHLHALLWGYVPLEPVLLPQARRLGFREDISIAAIPPMTRNSGDIAAFIISAYLVRQYHGVFGTRQRSGHLPAPPGKREFLVPHAATLQAHEPRLLRNLEAARRRSVPDAALCRQWP
jgi:hypothetical protein